MMQSVRGKSDEENGTDSRGSDDAGRLVRAVARELEEHRFHLSNIAKQLTRGRARDGLEFDNAEAKAVGEEAE